MNQKFDIVNISGQRDISDQNHFSMQKPMCNSGLLNAVLDNFDDNR